MLRSTFKKITHFHITKAFAIVIILCCGTAWGATNYQWTGASGDGLWNTPGNWKGNAVPTTEADVVIPNVSSHPTVTLNEATANLSSLTIAYGMTLVCNNKNVTATTITNSGSIKLSGAETVTATKTDLNGSTIEYTGSANSSIWGNSYYNLTVSGGTLTLTENTTVAGSLSVTTGATLVTGNYTLTVNDTTTNSGTISATGSGTLEFNGSVTNTSIISCETGSITFSDAVTNTSGTLSTTSGKIINSYTSGQSFVGTVKITTAGGSVENSSTAALTVANLNLTAAGTLNATSGDITVTNLTNTTPSNISILGSKTVTLPAGSAAALIVGDGSTTTAAVLSGDFSATSVTVKSNAKLTATTGTLTCTGDFTNSGNSSLNNTTLSPSSSITITGTATASATSFGTLTCTGAGGKTLKIGGAITVGTIDLSGTSALSLLTVNSNAATDSITLATANTTAQYLSIGGVSGSTGFGPKIITRTITANNSKSYTTSGSLPAGWYFSSYIWTGATADWSLASNWDCNAVPVSSSDVVTIPASSSYTNAPLYSSASNTTINSITLDDSTSKLTLSAAGNIKLSTASSLSNAGTIIYSGAGRITDSSPTSAFINDVDKGTVEYKNANTITDFDTGTGNDYFNLVIDTGAIATLGGNISVGKKLTINGTVDGAYVLSVVGDAVIAAAIGETTPITSISVTGASSISANIKTTGTQTYSGNVTLGADTTFTSTDMGATGAITFGTNISNTISGTGKAISVATAGAVTFNSKIATSTTDAIGNISQTGDGSVTFNGAVYAGAISDTGSGTVTFANPVTATSIEITGVAAINTTSVTTTGTQTYSGNVTLGANTTFTSTGAVVVLSL